MVVSAGRACCVVRPGCLRRSASDSLAGTTSRESARNLQRVSYDAGLGLPAPHAAEPWWQSRHDVVWAPSDKVGLMICSGSDSIIGSHVCPSISRNVVREFCGNQCCTVLHRWAFCATDAPANLLMQFKFQFSAWD